MYLFIEVGPRRVTRRGESWRVGWAWRKGISQQRRRMPGKVTATMPITT